MENQQNSSKKIILNYGLYFGIISILVAVIRYALGVHYDQDWKVGALSFIIMAVIIVLGIKKYKESNNGFLSLGEGLKTGIGIALIGGLIGIVYTIIFMTVIEPDFMDKSIEIAREKLLEDPRFSEEQIDAQLEMQKKFSSPGIIAAVGIIWTLFLGFVISLIASLVMKKQEDQY